MKIKKQYSTIQNWADVKVVLKEKIKEDNFDHKVKFIIGDDKVYNLEYIISGSKHPSDLKNF